MNNYPTSSHTLEFSANYKKLIVRDAAQVIKKEFELDDGSNAVEITVHMVGSTESYGVSVIAIPAASGTEPLAIDIAGSPSLTFNGNRLGGTVIIDLRDIGRYSGFGGTATISCHLECTPFRFWYLAEGGKALRGDFDTGTSTDCFTYS